MCESVLAEKSDIDAATRNFIYCFVQTAESMRWVFIRGKNVYNQPSFDNDCAVTKHNLRVLFCRCIHSASNLVKQTYSKMRNEYKKMILEKKKLVQEAYSIVSID